MRLDPSASVLTMKVGQPQPCRGTCEICVPRLCLVGPGAFHKPSSTFFLQGSDLLHISLLSASSGLHKFQQDSSTETGAQKWQGTLPTTHRR